VRGLASEFKSLFFLHPGVSGGLKSHRYRRHWLWFDSFTSMILGDPPNPSPPVKSLQSNDLLPRMRRAGPLMSIRVPFKMWCDERNGGT
jgi:hypothetical protein